MSKTKEEILAAIGKVSEKTAAARERKIAKGSASGYTAIWNEAMIDAGYGDERVAPTAKNMAALKRAIGRLPVKSIAAHRDFIEWSVSNWELLVADIFGKRKHYPVPSLNFFISAIDRFYNAYCRKGGSPVSSGDLQKTIDKQAKQIEDLRYTIKELEGVIKVEIDKNKKLESENKRLRSARTGKSGKIGNWD